MAKVTVLAYLGLGTLQPVCTVTQDITPSRVVSGTTERELVLHGIEVASRPVTPFIERRNGEQLVNFDLLVTNRSSTGFRLVSLKLSVFDRKGSLELERELNENGHPPGLDVIGVRSLRPGALADFYQPFYEFGPEVDLGRLHIDLLFVAEGHASPPVAIHADAVASVDVQPTPYYPVSYCLPLRGLIVVHDGHDFYSHHRRYNLAPRYDLDPSSAMSANLYAYDFMRTTSSGSLFSGDPNQTKDWLTYGEPVFAPADGMVLETVSDLPENTFESNGDIKIPEDAKRRDPSGFGNHIEIQHQDGRVSWLLHMQSGSVTVKAGDHVQQGERVGRVGFSGDSLFPHLHYTVTDGPAYPSQGVPSYFKEFVRVLGTRKLLVKTGQTDSGDIVESSVPCPRRSH